MKKTLALIIIVSFLSCQKEHNYSYLVTGSAASFNVTIEAAPSGTSQHSNVPSGWKYIWTQKGNSTRFLYLSAQNNTNAGTVTVKIIRDGETLKEASSSGAYVIASVDGDL
jgi:hypothetical protein